MAMVYVKKGKNTMYISNGAFNEFYKRQGWEIVDKDKLENIEEDEQVIANKVEDIKVDDEIEEENEEEVIEDKRELDEIPLKEMSLNELKEFAKLKEINIEGLSEKKEIRKAIKEALNN